ncbi:MAG: hypothetical protein M1836_004932 [Candelina mexicana]|nr:MAG: hypothetical protein M1836_004932 [Candelina mexicana]
MRSNPPPSPTNPSRSLPPSPRPLTNEENLALIDINYAGPTPRDTPRDTPRASIETTHSHNTQASSRRLLPARTSTTDTSSSSSSGSNSQQGRVLRRRSSPHVTIDPIPRLHPSPVRSPSRSPHSRNGTRASRRRNSGTARKRSGGRGGGGGGGKEERKAWSASDYPIEGMSEKEIERCRKKGINPRLKAEMDAAMRGRRFSPLVGNTYIG